MKMVGEWFIVGFHKYLCLNRKERAALKIAQDVDPNFWNILHEDKYRRRFGVSLPDGSKIVVTDTSMPLLFRSHMKEIEVGEISFVLCDPENTQNVSMSGPAVKRFFSTLMAARENTNAV